MDLSQPGINVSATLHDLFNCARAAYGAARMPDVQARREALSQLERLLTENVEEIATAISADFSNRSVHETKLLEIFPSRTA